MFQRLQLFDQNLAGAFKTAFFHFQPGMGIVGFEALLFGQVLAVSENMLVHFGFKLVESVFENALELTSLDGRRGVTLGKNHQFFEGCGKGGVFFKGETRKDSVSHFPLPYSVEGYAMTMKTAITYEELTRQERLLIWLRRANLNNAQIAEALNVSAIAISRWFRAESIPSWRHRQLVDFGIPAELLPPAVDKAPGRQRREKALFRQDNGPTDVCLANQ